MKRHPVLPLAAALIVFLSACTAKDVLLSNQGLKDISMGNYEQAEVDLQKALAINPDNPYALLNLGVVYQNTGRSEKAREMYLRVLALNPKEKAASSNEEGVAGLTLGDIAKRNLGLLDAQEAEERKRAEAERAEREKIAAMEKAPAPPPEPGPPPAPPLPTPPPKPQPPPSPLPPAVQPEPPPAGPMKPGHYKTLEGDSLAQAAARKGVYGNPLMWPSLFRLNSEIFKSAKDSSAVPRLKLPAGIELRFVTAEKAAAARTGLGTRLWAVNVASVEQQSLMGGLVVPLVRLGYRPYLTETRVKAKTFRRLRVGFFKDRSEAVAAAKGIQRALKLSAHPWVQEVPREEFERYAGY